MSRNRKSAMETEKIEEKTEGMEVPPFKPGFFVPVHPVLLLGRFLQHFLQVLMSLVLSDLLWVVPYIHLHPLPLHLPPLLPPLG